MDKTSMGEVINGLVGLLILGVVLGIYIKTSRIERKQNCHTPPVEEEAVKIDLSLDEKK